MKLITAWTIFGTILVILLLLTLPNCEAAEENFGYLKLGATLNTNPSHIKGDSPLSFAQLGFTWRMSQNWYGDVFYLHQSSIEDGPPFNMHKDERWTDGVGFAFTLRFY